MWIDQTFMARSPVLIAPSLLNADFANLQAEVSALQSAGADWIHIDVMDGQFVPPITFGAAVMKSISRHCSLPFDVHLMVEKPEGQLEAFRDAGAARITVHVETCPHLHRTLQSLHDLGVRAGVAVNPGTPVELIESVIDEIDLILIMTVNPGWGGQKFIESTLSKVAKARALASQSSRAIEVQVDGGVNPVTAKSCVDAGASVLVVGSYILESADYAQSIQAVRNATATSV